ncbi:zf-C3HC4_2 domain-containing protein [Cephalotus follicularis]|uniref:RING-type E3 ubiquitin transferase n=1 Tax=Cephalotus follicularis TaxID=3775 RepID=A0A1Q3BZ42_CEPFO|nr:zf-C3HC4_2 domain-containing protein [Cephalotus follicularis]
MASNSSPKSRNREKMVKRVILPAIEGQNCPICLNNLRNRKSAVITACNHAYCLKCIQRWSNLNRKCPLCNAHFDSWFYKINLAFRSFLTHHLPPLAECKTVNNRARDRQRVMRDESNSVRRRRWRPFPIRRSFGRPGSVPENVFAERILQWRARLNFYRVYNRRVQAVPLSLKNCDRRPRVTAYTKEGLRWRIQLWIQRELTAILGDIDTLIIVHISSSLFISSVEKEYNTPSGQRGIQEDFLEPLRPFLQDRTDLFWHELRCFAESSLSMETYDTVVEYKQMD